MKTKVKIISFSVLQQHAVSIKVLCWSPDIISRVARDEKKRITLDETTTFEGKIRSINIQREGTHVLIRTRKSRYLVNRLLELMDKTSIDFSITEILDNKISQLLSIVSERTHEPTEKILVRLTTYKDKEGNEVPGKETIEDLTEGQKSYVFRRLSAITKEEGESLCLVS